MLRHLNTSFNYVQFQSDTALILGGRCYDVLKLLNIIFILPNLFHCSVQFYPDTAFTIKHFIQLCPGTVLWLGGRCYDVLKHLNITFNYVQFQSVDALTLKHFIQLCPFPFSTILWLGGRCYDVLKLLNFTFYTALVPSWSVHHLNISFTMS